MTRTELALFFPFSPSCPLHIGAGSYAVPTLNWFQGAFWDFFHQECWNRDENKWKTRFQCRDFASKYRIMAVECWAATEGIDSTDEGLSVGEVWFKPDPLNKPLDGHAICPIICEQGLVYIDPQNNTLWPMSSGQFASRFYLRF